MRRFLPIPPNLSDAGAVYTHNGDSDARSVVRMREPKLQTNAVLILSSLAEGERHGYAIRKDIAQRSGDEVKLGVTTLYRILKQLLDAGLIEESERRPSPALDDERRRYYRVTASGRRALAAEIRRLERVLAAARAATAPGRPR